mmetsp:Transcript_71608/g.203164  ORF Transcript_71608/g.203164 Transcript_71608/m.203164 type:complete len:403 (-) Transcript_71608:888-2096(-)
MAAGQLERALLVAGLPVAWLVATPGARGVGAAPVAGLAAGHAGLEALLRATVAVRAAARARLLAELCVRLAALALALVAADEQLGAWLRALGVVVLFAALPGAGMPATLKNLLTGLRAWLQGAAEPHHTVPTRSWHGLSMAALHGVQGLPCHAAVDLARMATGKRNWHRGAAGDIRKRCRVLDRMAWLSLGMPAGQVDVDEDFARAWADVRRCRRVTLPTRPVALVGAAGGPWTLAHRGAANVRMLRVEGVATEGAPMPAAGQQRIAVPVAASVASLLFEVLSRGDQAIILRVFWAPQVQGRGHAALAVEQGQHLEPLVVAAEHLLVPYDVEAMPRARESHNDAVFNCTESELPLGITSDQGDDYDIILLSLVVVDGHDTDPWTHLPHTSVSILPFALTLAT